MPEVHYHALCIATHNEDVTVLSQDGGGMVQPHNLGLGSSLSEALAIGLIRLVDLQPAASNIVMMAHT
jgi:hypothetical protein